MAEITRSHPPRFFSHRWKGSGVGQPGRKVLGRGGGRGGGGGGGAGRRSAPGKESVDHDTPAPRRAATEIPGPRLAFPLVPLLTPAAGPHSDPDARPPARSGGGAGKMGGSTRSGKSGGSGGQDVLPRSPRARSGARRAPRLAGGASAPGRAPPPAHRLSQGVLDPVQRAAGRPSFLSNRSSTSSSLTPIWTASLSWRLTGPTTSLPQGPLPERVRSSLAVG